MEYIVSFVTLLISIIALFLTYLIYKKQKSDSIIESFYNDLAYFMSETIKGPNIQSHVILVQLKLKAGFLNSTLYDEFNSILPILEHLNLTKSNPNRDLEWVKIIDFIYNFTKAYNPKTTLTKEYLKSHL